MKKNLIKRMISVFLATVICSLLWLPASAEVQPRLTGSNSLGIPIIGQGNGTELCWAACGASVVNYLTGSSETATTFKAKSLLGDSAIGANTLSSILTNKFSITNTCVLNSQPSVTTIINQINTGKPIIALLATTGSGASNGNGHFVVIYGYSYNDTYGFDNMIVYFMDPDGNGSYTSQTYATLTESWVINSYIYNLSA